MNRTYKCTQCDYVFDHDERRTVVEKHGFYDDVVETFSCCPCCGGNYEEVVDCCECGESFTEKKLYDGWCEKCLRETINYDTFFEYCEANKDRQYLDIFVMSLCFDGMDAPSDTTEKFHNHLIALYKGMVEMAQSVIAVGVEDSRLLPACIRFIMDDDGSIGRGNYADWLNKREVKTNA